MVRGHGDVLLKQPQDQRLHCRRILLTLFNFQDTRCAAREDLNDVECGFNDVAGKDEVEKESNLWEFEEVT